MKNKLSFLILILSFKVIALTESQVVEQALQSNSEIILMHAEAQSDSISLQISRSEWLPKIGIGAEYVTYPSSRMSQQKTLYTRDSLGGIADTIKYSETKNDYLKDSYSASLNFFQPIPSGAQINATATIFNETNKNSILSLGITQPLLGGFGKFNPTSIQNYRTVKLKEESSLYRKKQFLGQISDIRKAFWDYYTAYSLVGIADSNKAWAIEYLKTERAKFSTGQASAIDTLSAAVEFLRAEQAILTSTSNLQSSKQNLSILLAIPIDSIGKPDSAGLSFGEIPEANLFIEQAEKFDPQLKVFETASQRLSFETAILKNNLLPTLNIGAELKGASEDNYLFQKNYSVNSVLKLILQYNIINKKERLSYKSSLISEKMNAIKLNQYKDILRKQIIDISLQWKKEKMQLSIAQALEDLSRKKYVVTARSYELGLVDRLEYIKTRNDYLSTQTDYLNKLITMKQLEISIDQILGTVTQRFGVHLQ